MKRGTMWPVAMAAILGIGVAANVWLIRVASADPSFAVEEDYYQKALRWDEELAQRARNDSLGWTGEPVLTTTSSDAGATLRVTIRDARGLPVQAGSVRVRAMHIARASDVLEAELAPSPGGGYVTRLPIHRSGLWELRLEAWRGADRFTAVRRIEARLPAP